MISKRPFQDARNQWWIYRSDDPDMHAPLGPFFTPDYALEIERSVRGSAVPMPRAFDRQMPVYPSPGKYRYMED